MTAYYNEIDPKAAAWLRELIKRGLIADGVVDERSIIDVAPDELRDFTQCHFFAGIGVWSYALRSAGWADDRPVWTGSCPCQPFSAAGRRGGVDDERHLWPHWHHLISQCHPATIFGEQVASKDGLGWLDLVCADMEATGYAIGAADLCAAGVGAPHIRQRLFFGATRLADADAAIKGMVGNGSGSMGGRGSRDAWLGHRSSSSDGRLADAESFGERSDKFRRNCSNRVFVAGSGSWGDSLNNGANDRMADAADARLQIGRGGSGQQPGSVEQSQRLFADGGMADAGSGGSPQGLSEPQQRQEGDAGEHDDSRYQRARKQAALIIARTGPLNRVWRDADWLFCRDGKWRPVEPGTFPLAHGSAQRVGRLRGYGAPINAEKSAEARVMRLRGYGNAIIPNVAAAFIGSFTDAVLSQM